MITPAFFGLYNAHRGLIAAQTALDTINHNIANANTPGYSRQRVDLEAHFPYAKPGHNLDISKGQKGQGVSVTQITRVRDAFIDGQFRLESGIFGQNSIISDVLKQVEGILAEPSTGGINSALENFFNAAQELSLHPESIAVRQDFVQQAVDMITVFQQQAIQLRDLRRNLVGDTTVPSSINTSQLAYNVNEVNEKLASIHQVNQEILTIISSGAQPNDLYDKRDHLIDQLSEIIDVNVTNTANGQIDLSIGGQTLIRGTRLVDTLQVLANPGPAPPPTDAPTLIQTVNGGLTINSNITSGRIRGILNVGGNNPNTTTIRGTLENLNALVTNVVNEVNAINSSGYNLNGVSPPLTLFLLAGGTTLNIFRYSVNTNVINNPAQVAAAINAPGFAGPGDGRNALAMAQLRNQTIAGLGNVEFGDYFNAMVSQLGIDTRGATERTEVQGDVIQNLEQRRQSISGVNTDEEMIDMLRFQRSFEASSRMIQVFDEVIQSIINLGR